MEIVIALHSLVSSKWSLIPHKNLEMELRKQLCAKFTNKIKSLHRLLNIRRPHEQRRYLMSMREYACIWSWFRRINGKRSTLCGSNPNCSRIERNLCLTLSQQNGLHLTISRECGTAHRILAQTCRTLGVICIENKSARIQGERTT